MSYRGLGFIYTNKCTSNCSICCFNCSPKCNYKLSKEKVIEIIGEAIKMIYSQWILGKCISMWRR